MKLFIGCRYVILDKGTPVVSFSIRDSKDLALWDSVQDEMDVLFFNELVYDHWRGNTKGLEYAERQRRRQEEFTSAQRG